VSSVGGDGNDGNQHLDGGGGERKREGAVNNVDEGEFNDKGNANYPEEEKKIAVVVPSHDVGSESKARGGVLPVVSMSR